VRSETNKSGKKVVEEKEEEEQEEYKDKKKRTAITTEINFSTRNIRKDYQRLSETVFLSVCQSTAHIH